MDWRARLLRCCGPGLLGGITAFAWLKLLRAEGASIDFSRLPGAVAITAQSLKNSALGCLEGWRYHARLENVVVQPPLFILGHWRNGTTYLHQLIAQDQRFAYPNTYQTSFPHTFLLTEALDARLVSFFMPKHRPMDGMRWGATSPQEDEFALCVVSQKSPCLSWVFPRQKARFTKYLSFRTVDPAEIREWREALLRFVRKVQWRHGRPLVLKSPPHTARVRLLLELFPQAKFVHIHRDPYRVFQSSRRTFLTLFDWMGLQRPELDDLADWILRQYTEMYEAFFADRQLIPAGRLHEMSFEQLERDPVGELRKMYAALRLPDFRSFEPALQAYVSSLAGYLKNAFTDLSPDLKARIRQAWRACIEEWRYTESQP
jgi:omega-hydroxy-beta-dihydromenaquinone-9 sulfotransferase